MQDLLNSTEIKTYLPSAFPGSILIKPTTASTNADAKLLAEPYATVIAETQTAGRGRGIDRLFYSPCSTGIYLSIVLPYDKQDILKITPAVAVSVCQTIESFTDVIPKIKWVNDILMNRKKVCGILCETIHGTSLVVAGIGINFSTTVFPSAIADIAGLVFANPPISRNEFIGTLLTKLYEINPHQCIPEYRRRCCVIGKSITYSENKIWHRATVHDIDENGRLVVIENNKTKTLDSGEITLEDR